MGRHARSSSEYLQHQDSRTLSLTCFNFTSRSHPLPSITAPSFSGGIHVLVAHGSELMVYHAMPCHAILC